LRRVKRERIIAVRNVIAIVIGIRVVADPVRVGIQALVRV
jgi:hypothetical protein